MRARFFSGSIHAIIMASEASKGFDEYFDDGILRASLRSTKHKTRQPAPTAFMQRRTQFPTQGMGGSTDSDHSKYVVKHMPHGL